MAQGDLDIKDVITVAEFRAALRRFLRRSELVALNVEDLEESELGFKVAIWHSKTDQEGAGQAIAIVRGSVACPVAALKVVFAAVGAERVTPGPPSCTH